MPEGIGPVFNDVSCAACHSTPAVGGGSTTIETRFGRMLNGQFDPMTEFGGSLIQKQGIGLFNGVNFVGEVVPPQATIVAGRRTTPLFGLGLVGAVPDRPSSRSPRPSSTVHARHGRPRQRGHRPGHGQPDRGPIRLEVPARLAVLVLGRRLPQ